MSLPWDGSLAVATNKFGSAENWVGYHVVSLLALHKWFLHNQRPVPRFLFLDQPTQAHYPPDLDSDGSLDVLDSDDRQKVKQLFAFMLSVAEELGLQVIVLDHADLPGKQFKDAVTERWRRGKALIPQEWLAE